ncbi:hypothetical protein BJY01DRAFT_258645 [Aspergillus pseudoustus]|uniref:F-box domain-containing protein n=1 Tax=Aspergillus pseudoustus TaxID=1810923 RepID=A0ABR4J8R9_9EURO
MPHAALDTLPLEVTSLIFNCLRPKSCGALHPDFTEPPDVYFHDGSQESSEPAWYSLQLQPLLSLCLVCKRLGNLAQPLLHREFLLGYGDSWRSNRFTWSGRLIGFMRTVARRRDLAAQVTRIFIHPEIWESHRSKTVVERWQSEQNPVWRSRCPFSWSEVRLSEDDLIAVLILELPNLQYCSLQVGVDTDEIAPGASFRAALISRLPIKTVDLNLCATSCEVRKSYGKFSIIQRAFSLLNLSMGLETLNLHQYYGSVLRDDIDPIPALPNLKNLRLTFSWLNERTLQSLLSSCGSLQTFHYEATSNPERNDIGYYFYILTSTGNIHFRLTDAVKHLSSHCKTLKSVHLDLRMRGFTQCTPEPWTAFSLEQFTTLQHLFLTLDEFHSVYMVAHASPDQGLITLLPSSIISLYLAGQITDELSRMEESLIGLAEGVLSGQLPNLEVVRWDETERLSAGFPVHTMFSAAGVDFSYSSWPLSKSTLGESQRIGHPSWFDDGFRGDLLNYVPPDEEDPDL